MSLLDEYKTWWKGVYKDVATRTPHASHGNREASEIYNKLNESQKEDADYICEVVYTEVLKVHSVMNMRTNACN